MVSITISIDNQTYEFVRWYMELKDLDNMSQACRSLIKKGVAHEKQIAAQEQA